jgi:N4-gp56 family major capsid protein
MDLCGEQAAETVEVVRIAVLKAGTNVYYPGSATSRGTVNSSVTRGALRKVVRGFRRNKGREISRIVGATAKVSTEPVAPAFFAMGHTDLDSDIRTVSGFVPIEQYSQSSKALPGEIGKVESIRFILSALFEPWEASGASGTTYLANGSAPSSSTSCDVYPLLIVAKDAYGIVPLQGKSAVKPMVLNPGTPSKSDALGQVGYVSWKTYQTAAILNENWIARLEVAATANPS